MLTALRRGLLVSATALLVLLASASPASGHALLLRSDPAQDARLFDPPVSVMAWFSEPLEAGVSSLKVVDAIGRRVDAGTTEVDAADPTKMSVSFAERLGPGFYFVTWETLSRIDGHFRFGSFQFAVLNPDGSLPPGPGFTQTGGGEPLEFDRSLVKALSLLGQVGLVGAMTFYLWVARPVARREGAASTAAVAQRQLASGALTSVALLLFAGTAGIALQTLESPMGASVRDVLATSWGERWLQQQLALIVTAALLVAYRARPGLLWLALGASILYLALTSASSHSAAIERGSFWATAFDFVHLLAATVWVGGLAQLARLLFWSRKGLDDDGRALFVAEALRRFSLIAATAVVPLLASGVLNGFIQIPRLSALFHTNYGLTLTVKLMLVIALLGVAAANAFVLRPSVIRLSTAGARNGTLPRLLSRLVVLEASLGVAVLLVTGLLTQLTTARALAQIAGDAAFTAGSDLASPLVAGGDWALIVSIALLAVGFLGVVWTREASGCLGWTVRNVSRVTAGVPLIVLLVLAVDAATPSQSGQNAPGESADGTRRFQPQLSLLLQAGENRFVSLQAAPFQVGDNVFRVTVLDKASGPLPTESLTLRFSSLEREGVVGEVQASLDAASGSFFADFALAETGWWNVDAVADGQNAASFYVRLDQPSRAPDSFAPPDYESDPEAQTLFERALSTYHELSSVTWNEQLTSGSDRPTGYGVWFVSMGEALAPDDLHFRVLDQEGLKSDRYYLGSKACSRIESQPLECSEVIFRPDVFELDYMQPTAFKLGREEVVDGEMSRVVLMYNPNQQAWYAWWVGLESGLLRRQAMVATGHFMLTRFEAHNAPLTIQLPDDARP